MDSPTKGAATPAPCNCCAELFTGKASGTMVAAEDDTCRDIPPGAGVNGSVLYQHPNVNQGFQYWEGLENLAAALAPLVAQAMAAMSAKPAEAPAPRPAENPPLPFGEQELM